MNDLREILHEQNFSGAERDQFISNKIIYDWDKIVDASIAAQVCPVKFEYGILFVDVKNSAFKDQLKFVAEEIIDAVNEHFAQAEPLVKDLRPAKSFQVIDAPKKKSLPAQIETSNAALKAITLTQEEIDYCREQAENFSNDELRPTVLATLLSQVRIQKFRQANGWHKCVNCAVLCPPNEIFCDACKIKAREAMVEELYRIFYDEPWLKTLDAQKILLERMPQMRGECPPDVIESARTTLIQKVAGGIRYGDEDSPDVMKLVMLEKRLPPDKLTPAIIRRTLIDLQFNLSDQALLRRYNALTKAARK